MKYFITGATGFIGGRVAAQLIEQGDEVVALVRNPDRAGHLADLGATIAQGDITDKESMRQPMAGVDGVFHIAAWYRIGATDAADKAETINVTGTRNVLELMKELDIAKGVYTSSLAVFSDTGGRLVDENYYYDGPHLSVYDRTKWQAHYEVAEPMMAEGLPLVIVMPGAVYGPGDTSAVADTLKSYLRGEWVLVPKETALCWAHVDDVAQGHILAMEKGQAGEKYIIAGPRYTAEWLVTLAEDITGRPARRIDVPPLVMKGMARLMEIVKQYRDLPETYDPETLRALAGVTYTSTNMKAKRELGYYPRGLEEGLRQTLEHLIAEMEQPEHEA